MTKRAIGLAAVAFAVAVAAPADEPPIDDTIQQFDRDLRKLVSLLKDVKDQSTAAAAREQLVAIDKQVGAAFERLQKPTTQPAEASRKKLAEIQERWDELEQQMSR